MRRFHFLLAFVAALLSAQTPPRAAFEGIDEAVAQLSKVTGLAPLKKVQYDTITKAQVKAFLEERIKEEVKPEDIRIDELALKKFGFVPADFDLKTTTVELITEQAAAFYDYRKKKLFLLEAGENNKDEGAFARESQKMIVVHELAHALADQHFDLGKFIKRGRTDDASTARMAVMEGQATWLMLETMAQRMGTTVRDSPQMADLMAAGASDALAQQYPVLAGAPLYIRQSLIFPYNQGLKFQHALVQKIGNEAFTRVFRDPPSTTQHILHPELYLSRAQPVAVRAPALAKPKEWRTLTDGAVGEFDHAVLLEQYLSKEDADAIAPGWRGGMFALVEHKSDKRIGLLYASEWSDAAAARRMFVAYKSVLKGKWNSMQVTRESESEVEGTGDDGAFRLTLDGSRVQSCEGFKTADALPRRLN